MQRLSPHLVRGRHFLSPTTGAVCGERIRVEEQGEVGCHQRRRPLRQRHKQPTPRPHLCEKSAWLPQPSSRYADASPLAGRNEGSVATTDPATTLDVADARGPFVSGALQQQHSEDLVVSQGVAAEATAVQAAVAN